MQCSIRRRQTDKYNTVAMVTMVQLEEYLIGWTTLSWYNILHTVTTQVQTVQTPDSRGRQPLQGRDTATHSTNSRLNKHTCRDTDRSETERDRSDRRVRDRERGQTNRSERERQVRQTG